jgi:hypothetical protein
MRETLISRKNLSQEKERWSYEIEEFRKEFKALSVYPE